MKTKIVLNIIVLVLAILGVFFKIMHWPGAGIILVITVALLLYILFTSVAADNQGAGLSSFLNYCITGALAVFFLTFLFKVMHWPGAGILAALSSLIVLAVTCILVFSKANGNVSKEYVLMAFILFFMLDFILPNSGWKIIMHGGKLPKNKIVTVMAPTKMNVLYVGVDNPVKIALSNTDMSNLDTLAINIEKIVNHDSECIVNPLDVNKMAEIAIFQNGTMLGRAFFRVKNVPDPVAKVAGIKGAGTIDKKVLLEQKGPYAEMENFDFDLTFKVVEFKVCANIGGYSEDKLSNSNLFTQEQFELMKKVKPGQKVYFEDIKALGPDGAIRELGSIAITVK
jgi:hypothetical protein